MKIHIKDLKGGERVNQLFNGYLVTVDSPIKIETLDYGNGISYRAMATNDIDQKCKVFGYDEQTEDYVFEATIEIIE